ncbi:hypothetical protein BCR32DRAFT_289293 [Anaeromyces robustus]|uniref:Uncharacterized protein n=1 Tax=Anaeromyces robustus TaxID=1754192 RepID=A0A1Y1XNZ1_9FUNG|nr:hypothetical protein BCR32DRAFT_289293 [Anaeromyces robustus]|eukprot:ORX87469.1 hypothetical protein BCR32DRAFT_289293 [Anaeromyces robustus]
MESNIPENYTTPSWPSLAIPYDNFENRKVLYYKTDVINFIILWSMYINSGICALSSLFTFISIKKKRYIPIIVVMYAFYGGLTGIINGYLCGYAFWYVYNTLEFTVVTAHPLFVGIIQGAIFRILEFPNIRMNSL